MPVQVDQLSAINTTVRFEGFNTKLDASPLGLSYNAFSNDSITSEKQSIFHNGSDIGRLTSPQTGVYYQYRIIGPVAGGQIEYLTLLTDGEYTSPRNLNTSRYFIYLSGLPINTNFIKFYTPIQLSLTTTFEVNLTAGDLGSQTISYTYRSDLSPAQHEYTVTFDDTGAIWGFSIDLTSFDYDPGFNQISEIVVGNGIGKPILRYYGTDGTEKVGYEMEYKDILDMCCNTITDSYYTVRFKYASGALIDPDDSFVLPSGSAAFDSTKWSIPTIYNGCGIPVPNVFYKDYVNEKLKYLSAGGTASGNCTDVYALGGGALECTAIFIDDFQANIDFNIITLSSGGFFGLHALEELTKNFIYGVGVTSGVTDSYYKYAVTSIVDTSSLKLSITEFRPKLINTVTGTEEWTFSFTTTGGAGDANWIISGSNHGLITSGISDPPANEQFVRYENDYFSCFLWMQADASLGSYLKLTTNYELDTRASSSGTINLEVNGTTFTSSNSLNFDETLSYTSTSDFKIRIVGENSSYIDLLADNFDIVSASGYTYIDIPALTVEETSSQGVVLNNIIENFNVILGNTSATTPIELLNGEVKIAVNGSDRLFLKVLDKIHTFDASINLSGVTNLPHGSISSSVAGLLPVTNISCLGYSDSNGGFLWYPYFNTATDETSINTLTASVPPTSLDRTAFLDIPDYEENEYILYVQPGDNDTFFYIRQNGTLRLNTIVASGTVGSVTQGSYIFTDSSKNFTSLGVKKGDLILINEVSSPQNSGWCIILAVGTSTLTLNRYSWPGTQVTNLDYAVYSNAELLQFNTDPDIAAFSSVSVDNYNLQAGTGEIANVTAEVINVWGDPLSGKTANFQVIQGDGVVNPASTTTNVSGIATTQFTVGSTAGPIKIQVTISD